MTAKEYLSQYSTLFVLIDCKREQIKELEAVATSVSPSASGFGSSGEVSDKVGKTVGKIVDLEMLVLSEIENLVKLNEEIRKQTTALSNLEYQYILEEHYFNGKPFEYIAEKLHCDRSTICRKHGTALSLIVPPE